MKLLKLTFGRGTQIARIESETERGYVVTRFHASEGYWYYTTSKLKKDDARIHTGERQTDIAADLVRMMKTALGLLNENIAKAESRCKGSLADSWLARKEAMVAQKKVLEAELAGYARHCKACSGDGVLASREQCPYCHGTGMVICPACEKGGK